MINRPTRPQIFMEIAHIIAKRSTCYRLNVGAVITSNDRIVCTGYNGVPPNSPHCSGNDCPGKNGCHLTIHAEQNALNYLPHGIKPEDLYVTHSPCLDCACSISSSGISRIFFTVPYRITTSLDLLREKNIKIYQMAPAGYIVDWFTKNLVSL